MSKAGSTKEGKQTRWLTSLLLRSRHGARVASQQSPILQTTCEVYRHPSPLTRNTLRSFTVKRTTQPHPRATHVLNQKRHPCLDCTLKPRASRLEPTASFMHAPSPKIESFFRVVRDVFSPSYGNAPKKPSMAPRDVESESLTRLSRLAILPTEAAARARRCCGALASGRRTAGDARPVAERVAGESSAPVRRDSPARSGRRQD